MKQDKKLATAKIIIFISKCTMPSENELGIKKKTFVQQGTCI